MNVSGNISKVNRTRVMVNLWHAALDFEIGRLPQMKSLRTRDQVVDAIVNPDEFVGESIVRLKGWTEYCFREVFVSRLCRRLGQDVTPFTAMKEFAMRTAAN